MQNPYEPLIEVIPDHPALRIMHFTETHSILVDELAALTRARDYEYLLLSPDETISTELSHYFAAHPHIKARSVAYTQTRFHVQAKMYDFVFVEAAVPDATDFLKKMYRAMKNAATLFVLSSGGHEEVERWRIGMEENLYVAFNAFELTDTLQVISGKKMHGWGG